MAISLQLVVMGVLTGLAGGLSALVTGALLARLRFGSRRTRARLQALSAALAFVLTWSLLWPLLSVPPAPGPPPAGATAAPAAPLSGVAAQPLNILVLGVDGGQLRTDVVIVAHWEPAHGLLNLVSLPRDTLVEIPCPTAHPTCISPDKLGHAHAYGEGSGNGPELARATVEAYLGIHIDYHVRVTFTGFERAADALGGIPIEVEPGLERIGLQPGRQTLTGEEALRYVRFRNDGRGDIGRIERTQRFLAALFAHARAQENRNRLPLLALTLLPQVATDLKPLATLNLLTAWTHLPQVGLQTATLPGHERWLRNLWFWEANPDGKAAMVRTYITAVRARDGAP